jgi:hypothetical protein
MYKATITGTLAIIAVSLLASGRAEAGGSASAASKYGHGNLVVAGNVASSKREARRTDFAITEYSSSSTRTHAPKYR